MKDKISIILPTMNRPQLLKECVTSIFMTTYGKHDVELVLIIDGNEDSVREIFYLMPQFTEQYGELKNWTVELSYCLNPRGALNSWNIGLAKSTGNLIFPLGDDALCHPNWLDYAVESHENKMGGYGFIGTNDLMLDGNLQLATHFLFDRKFCKDVLGGVIAYPVYNYYCIDSELNARAKAVNKFYWDSRSIVEHRHSANGKRPLDEHDYNRMNNNYMEIDNKIFEARKLANFPNDFDAVI